MSQCISSLLRDLKSNTNITDLEIARYITNGMKKDGFDKGISRSIVTKWQSETDTPEITVQDKYIKYIIYLAFQKAPDILKDKKYQTIIKDYLPIIVDELSNNHHNNHNNENTVIYYELNRTLFELFSNIYSYNDVEYFEYQGLVSLFYKHMLENNKNLFILVGAVYYEISLSYSLRKFLSSVYSQLHYHMEIDKLLNKYFLDIFSFLSVNTNENISFPYKYEISDTLKKLIDTIEKEYTIYYSPIYLYAEINIVENNIEMRRNAYIEELLRKCNNTTFEKLATEYIIEYKQKLNLE